MRRRLVSIAVVALLHVAIFAVLLRAIVVTPSERPNQVAPEMILSLLPPLPERTSRAPHQGVERRGVTAFPDVTRSPFVTATPQGMGLGQAMFGCRPEDLATLPREEQEKCARQTGFGYKAFADAPLKFPPHVDKITPLEYEARVRNAVDRCMAAKITGTECIDEIIFGKRLP